MPQTQYDPDLMNEYIPSLDVYSCEEFDFDIRALEAD